MSSQNSSVNGANCVKLLRYLAITISLIVACDKPLIAQGVVDATSLNNKIMAGYQGWFRCPGDRPGSTSWAHVFNHAGITAQNLAFDTWPDVSEFRKQDLFPVPGFTDPSSNQAYMYSPQNYYSVLKHFEWMKEYGIDGVWLSEFCGSFRNGHADSAMLTVMNNVRKAATVTGRTWAYMWDMSSFGPRSTKADVYNTIITQWKNMVDQGVTSDPRYLHHNGKPVLLIWGFFPGRPASQPDYMTPVLDFLLAPGKYQATLVAGADNKWRQGTPEFQAMLMRCAALQPWSVGRVTTDPATGYRVPFTDEWAADIVKCKENNVIFIPVINSGTNIAGPPPGVLNASNARAKVPWPGLPAVPRRQGDYLWQYFVAASKTGVINSAFVAMFDEINEGTQIEKISNHPPTQAPFLTYEGATSDYYLRLTGAGAKLLRSHSPVAFPIPVSPFDLKKTYIIKNKASGMALHNKDNTTVVQTPGDEAEWQIILDGKGYFTIKNRMSGKALAASAENDKLTQVTDTQTDIVKWHLEWDGTGDCRIVSKTDKYALSSNNRTTNGTRVIQVPDVSTPFDPKTHDELRWQIIEK